MISEDRDGIVEAAKYFLDSTSGKAFSRSDFEIDDMVLASMLNKTLYEIRRCCPSHPHAE